MNQTAQIILLLILLTAIIPAQESSSTAKSAIQFRDTTGTEKTAKIGWTGDAESGHFFVQTPNEGKVLRSNADGIEVDGTVKADKFSGDGSGLTNLTTEETTVSDVSGLEDALDDKADKSAISQKADTGWVKEKLEDMGVLADSASVAAKLGGKADTGWVNGKLGGKSDTADVTSKLNGKADTGWVKTRVEDAVGAVTVADDAIDSSKIVDGGISGRDIDPGTKLTVGDLSVGGKIGIGQDEPNTSLDIIGNMLLSNPTITDAPIFNIDGNSTSLFICPTVGQGAWNPMTRDGDIGVFFRNGDQNTGSLMIGPWSSDYTGIRITNQGLVGMGSILFDVQYGDNFFGIRGNTQNLPPSDDGSNAVFALTCNYSGGGGEIDFFNTNTSLLGGFKFMQKTGEATASDLMLIKGDGNVGIGTTNPKDKLHIVDDWRHTSTTDWGGGIRIEGSKPTISFWETSNNTPWMWNFYNDQLKLIRAPSDVDFQELAVFTSTGNLCLTGSVTCDSDRRFKTAITPLTSSLDKITALQGVNYLWDRASFPHKNFSDRLQVGLIAQDVEKVIPEVVSTDNEGYKSLAYDRLVPVLIEAVKEQKQIVEKQKSEIEQLRGELVEVKRYLGIR